MRMHPAFLLIGLNLAVGPSRADNIENVGDLTPGMLEVGDLTALGSAGVLEHVVVYEPLPPSPDYKSDDTFNPRGMEHVYLLANTFLNLIQRDSVLPNSLNVSMISDAISSGAGAELIADHWQDIMLQYIGVLTTAIFGLVLALVIPVVGFCFCCCRCCGRCGAYPDTHYDKRSDACKRVTIGVFLSLFVIAAVFGAVCAFVTNQYTYQGSQAFSSKLDYSLDDAGMYVEHTGTSVRTLLVTNYAELEEVIGEVLDESGPILKRSLATVTQAIAIDNLTSIVSGLGNVKRSLNGILNDTRILEEKVAQLQQGLSQSQASLGSALAQCNSNSACANFLDEFNLESDLALAEEFVSMEFKMPDITVTLKDISDLIENDIEKKVEVGKQQLDSVEGEIERSIDDIKPKVKAEIRTLGVQLEKQNNEIQAALREIDIGMLQKDVPLIDNYSAQYLEYRYYVGLSLASTVLLILVCFILGLFYGMCGKRPGGLYGDECCNKGTGANFLLSGVYFTFLFSFVILVLTTAHFLVGAAVEKVVCETLKSPQDSDIFNQVDQLYLQPTISQVLNDGRRSKETYSAAELIAGCHANQTIYTILKLEKVYNISHLSEWRSHYGIGDFIENLKNKVQLDHLSDIRLLSPSTARELEQLANSPISDMNFTRFTSIIENEITRIDLRSFVTRLRQLKQRVSTFDQSNQISSQLENQALWLEQMNKVVTEMKVTVRHLKTSVEQLQVHLKFNHSSMREAVTGLIAQANKATDFLQRQGPALINDLSEQFAGELVGLIDEYVDRVTNKIRYEVGYCAPMSTSINSTVVALCNEVVDPFNGFWAACGWCYLLYLPCIALAVSLISLYRKSEPYPGPLVESQPLEIERSEARGKKQKKGHRRNPSAFLPEYTHSRPPPQAQAQLPYTDRRAEGGRYADIAPRNWDTETGQPPRYTSNPSLAAASAGPLQSTSAGGGEYERPPPYYYPGPPADGGR